MNDHNRTKEQEAFMKNLRDKTLEHQTINLFHKTSKGRFAEFLVIVIGIGSVFVYHKMGINIIISLIFGFLTYLIIGSIFDRIIGKFFRLDKQIDWLQNHPDGQDFLKEKGVTSEEVTNLKKDLDI